MVDTQGNEIKEDNIFGSSFSNTGSSNYKNAQYYLLNDGQEAYVIRYYPNGYDNKVAFAIMLQELDYAFGQKVRRFFDNGHSFLAII